MIDMLSHAITSSPFGIWCKNTLVAVASCNTTWKICFASLANDNKIVWSSQYDVHWLALCNTTWYHLLTCLHTRYNKKCYYCCLLIVIQHKKGCRALSLLVMLVARILAMWQKKCQCRRFSQYDKKKALASNGIKAEWLHKSKATSQRLRVWRAFWLPFF